MVNWLWKITAYIQQQKPKDKHRDIIQSVNVSVNTFLFSFFKCGFYDGSVYLYNETYLK